MVLLWKLVVGTGTLVGLATGLATIIGGLSANWTDASETSRTIGGVLLYIAVVVVAPVVLVVWRRQLFSTGRGLNALVRGGLIGFAVTLYPFLVYILVDDMRVGDWDLFFSDMEYGGGIAFILAAIGIPYFGLLGYQRSRRSRKSCPDCCETVKAQARVCRYCGYRWEPIGGPEPARRQTSTPTT